MNFMDVIIYSGGEIGLDLYMIKLAEADIWVKYTKGTDDQKTKIHVAAKELSSHMLLSGGRQAPIWQNSFPNKN